MLPTVHFQPPFQFRIVNAHFSGNKLGRRERYKRPLQLIKRKLQEILEGGNLLYQCIFPLREKTLRRHSYSYELLCSLYRDHFHSFQNHPAWIPEATQATWYPPQGRVKRFSECFLSSSDLIIWLSALWMPFERQSSVPASFPEPLTTQDCPTPY